MQLQNNKIGWLEGIIEAIHDGILVIDHVGVVQLINEEYTHITGVSAEQIVGKLLQEVRPGALLPTVLKDGLAREGVFRKEMTMEYVVDMAPIWDQGKIIGAVSVCKSIPEVYRLNKELKKVVNESLCLREPLVEFIRQNTPLQILSVVMCN